MREGGRELRLAYDDREPVIKPILFQNFSPTRYGKSKLCWIRLEGEETQRESTLREAEAAELARGVAAKLQVFPDLSLEVQTPSNHP